MEKNKQYNMSYPEAQSYISERGLDIPWNDDDVHIDEREITKSVANVLKWADEHPIKETNINKDDVTTYHGITCSWHDFSIVQKKTVIAITLDDVLRAKTVQIGKIYQKHLNPDIDLEDIDFDDNNYQEIFGFEDKYAWEKFLYEDYAYEIFGEAGVCTKGLNLEFNQWLLDLDDNEEDVSVILCNPYEFNASIGFTCFFLSRMATKCRGFFFPKDSSDIWNKCDVLVTADPKLIESKPEGKICVKIEMPYNEECKADITYESLSEGLKGNRIMQDIKKINKG